MNTDKKINKDFFSKLRRIFTDDVIIHQISKDRVKLLDVNQTQQRSQLANNIPNSFNKPVFINSMNGVFSSSGLSNEIVRFQNYMDYEAMDEDAIISSALDAIASFSSLTNSEGQILKIISSDENVKVHLHNLFYEILDIDFNAWTWLRDLVKYGDLFLFLKIVEDVGVIGITPMDNYLSTVVQNERTGELTFSYSETNMSGNTYHRNSEGELKNYEVAHFKLNNEPRTFPYSRSYIEGARKSWQALKLMEDASLTHRLTRSADKRQWFIDMGLIAPEQIPIEMENLKNQMKRTPIKDPITGNYNMKFNMENILEDYFFPTRGSQSGTRIENLAGLTFAGMEDVEYHKQKVFNALMIPKAFLSETSELNGTSTLANLTLLFAQTIERVQKAFIQQLYKIAYVHLASKGLGSGDNLLNFELSMTPPSIIYEQERLATQKEKVDLIQQMLETNMYSQDYIYENVASISENEAEIMREGIIADKKRLFRLAQIENEGNDPLESGKSYGTPSDLASLYNDKMDNSPKAETKRDVDLGGRPKEHGSIIGTDDSNLGRDPIFKNRAMNTQYQSNTNPSDFNIREGKVNVYTKNNIISELNKSKLFNINLIK